MNWDEFGHPLPDKTFKVTVNGEVRRLYETVVLIDHPRAVRLAGLPAKRAGYYNICFSYPDKPGLWHQLLAGEAVSIIDDMYIEVALPDKRWWEFWK